MKPIYLAIPNARIGKQGGKFFYEAPPFCLNGIPKCLEPGNEHLIRKEPCLERFRGF